MGLLTINDGLKALAAKQYEAVHQRSIEAIKRDAKDAVPYFLLGVLALDHRNLAKAQELFEKAEILDRSKPHYPAYLGKLWLEGREPEQAKIAADRAATLSIADGYLADMIGVIYSRTGFHELAIPLFEKSVSLDGSQSNYFYNLGASAQFKGDFESAAKAYQSAVTLDEQHYRAWASLISLKRQTPDDNHLPVLKNLFKKLADNEDAVQQLGHAIAKTLEDIDRHKDSFDYLMKAKAIKRKRFGYNRIASQNAFAAAKATAIGAAFKSSDDFAPIFITGLPRTGTTLVDRILSSHSKVVSAGELNFFAELIKAETGTESNLVMDAKTFKASHDIDLRKIGNAYKKKVKARVGDHSMIIDKLPLNFFYAGLILRALPNARIITLRRGAMDSCLSNYRQLLAVQESFYNYTFDLEDTAFFYRQFDALIAHWREHIPETHFMEVRYEDIVFDQENQTRRLLSFCGLDFEEACMRFHENAAPVATASAVQVRQPLYSGSIDRWKKYGDKLDPLQKALGDLA